MSEVKYFAGVEGGASETKIVFVDSNGEIVHEGKGLSTNMWVIGKDECVKRIAGM